LGMSYASGAETSGPRATSASRCGVACGKFTLENIFPSSSSVGDGV
jgi:hypothetical protein